MRIFTYAVGPHPLPTTALKQMACATDGSFSTITAMGAIRTKIQVTNYHIVLHKKDQIIKLKMQSSYVGVIARPEVLSGQHVLAYSPVYAGALVDL